MMETPRPNILSETDTVETVYYYDNHMPAQTKDAVTAYLIVHGERREVSELNQADWLILNALYPNGPERIS